MRWFLQQEVAGEAGFDDLVAMCQVKMPTQAKLELARNYWDEMGRGAEAGMHGPMLDQLAKALELEPTIEDDARALAGAGEPAGRLLQQPPLASLSRGRGPGRGRADPPWRAERVAEA